jgi:hypothetical protein
MMPGLSSVMLQSVDLAAGAGATAYPTSVSKTISSTDGLSHSATTPVTTLSATGGTAPYTYAWELDSGDASITITSPSSASTTFSASLAPDEAKTATFTGTVTDANGVKMTANVSATLHHVDLR